MKTPKSTAPEALLALEEELRALTPAAPSDGFRARIREALDRSAADPVTPASASVPVWIGWLPLAAAATIALLAVVFTQRPGATPHGELAANTDGTPADAAPANPALGVLRDVDWQPLSNDSLLKGAAYQGVQETDGKLYRAVRMRYEERRKFKNHADGSTVEMTFPREIVQLIPVQPE